MSQRFDVRIVNKFKKGTLKVFMGVPFSEKTGGRLYPVKWKSGERVVVVNDPKDWVVIKAPEGVDIRQHSIHVGSRIDVDAKCRIKEREWTIKFPYCDDPDAESPADVNITLAPDEYDG
jgi:hypothetical protein